MDNKKNIKVIYANWQYECCGLYFKVNDYVIWSATPYNEDLIFFNCVNPKIDFRYEGCGNCGTGDLIGKVIKIELYNKNTALLNKEAYNFYKEVEEATDEEDLMVITLEEPDFKEYNENYTAFFKRPTIVLKNCNNGNDLLLSKNLKKNDYNLLVITQNSDIFEKVELLHNIKSFSTFYGEYKRKANDNDLSYLTYLLSDEFANNLLIFLSNEKFDFNCLKEPNKTIGDFSFYNIINNKNHIILEKISFINYKFSSKIILEHNIDELNNNEIFNKIIEIIDLTKKY